MRKLFSTLYALMLIGMGAACPAAPGGSALTEAQLLGLVRESVEEAARRVMQTHPDVRVEVQVGTLSPQLRLAPCEAAQPHFNPGARAWGDIRIGLRCVQGPVRWNIFVPASVRVYGAAWTSATALPAGHVLAPGDLIRQEAELSAESGPPVVDVEAATGRALATALRPGQALRTTQLRARQWFGAGQAVTLVAKGAGFAVTAEGVALTAGLEGQSTAVRLESGRVVQGMPVGGRRVEVAL